RHCVQAVPAADRGMANGNPFAPSSARWVRIDLEVSGAWLGEFRSARAAEASSPNYGSECLRPPGRGETGERPHQAPDRRWAGPPVAALPLSPLSPWFRLPSALQAPCAQRVSAPSLWRSALASSATRARRLQFSKESNGPTKSVRGTTPAREPSRTS